MASDGDGQAAEESGTELDGEALAACAASGGATPTSIAEVVTRINALPAPASIACLVASLPRPLTVVAVDSRFSAQPANGPHSPRIFILLEGLSLSVVPLGEAPDLLEFGEWSEPQRTLKGELEFPVLRPLSEDAPYERPFLAEWGSKCGYCHSNETPHPSIANAFVSDIVYPSARAEVSLASLQEIRAACEAPQGKGPHCTLLRALLDYGEVRQGSFEPAAETEG